MLDYEFAAGLLALDGIGEELVIFVWFWRPIAQVGLIKEAVHIVELVAITLFVLVLNWPTILQLTLFHLSVEVD